MEYNKEHFERVQPIASRVAYFARLNYGWTSPQQGKNGEYTGVSFVVGNKHAHFKPEQIDSLSYDALVQEGFLQIMGFNLWSQEHVNHRLIELHKELSILENERKTLDERIINVKDFIETWEAKRTTEWEQSTDKEMEQYQEQHGGSLVGFVFPDGREA